MKSFKNSVVVIILLLISGAAMADCDRNSTTIFDKAQCAAQPWIDQAGRFATVSGRLYQDRDDLGLTDQERVGVKNYYHETEKDISKRCGRSDNECRYQAYTSALNEVLAYDKQKKIEKQKRMAQVARPSLSSSLKQPSKKNYADYTPAELKKLQEENTRKLQQMEQSNSEEFEGD